MKETIFGTISLVTIATAMLIMPSLFMAVWFDTFFWLRIAASFFLAAACGGSLIKLSDKLL